MSGECFPQRSQTGKQQQGKDRRGQQTVLQAVAPGGGHQSHQTGTAEHPRSPARASRANRAVPLRGKQAAVRLKVPGHMQPTAMPHRAHPTSARAGQGERETSRYPAIQRMVLGRHKAGGGGVAAAVWRQ